jgi:hypothetical protein
MKGKFFSRRGEGKIKEVHAGGEEGGETLCGLKSHRRRKFIKH